jgi:multiple sugar transport system ATP-binding protein
MASVSIENLVKDYGHVRVLHGVNLTFADGEFVVLLGPSGCGKSTMLRMIAGLEGISGGAIRIGDTVVNDVPARDRGIAMVFQNYALYPHMSAYDNMAFGLRRLKVPRAEIDTRVKRVAELLALTPLLDRKPKQLSGGQQQRVAMGRAMIKTPQVFLFDEPLSNLDAMLRDQLRIELKKLHGLLKTTVVFVTHDQLEAMTLADKIVVMKDGVVEQVGTPADVYHAPASLFVARFIGSPAINLVPMRVSGDGHRLEGDAFSLDLGPDHGGLRPGQAVTLGVRPKDLQIAAADRPTHLSGSVVLAEMLGAETLMQVKVGAQELAVLVPYREARAQGASVAVVIPPDAAYLFDTETGKRIVGASRSMIAGATVV